MKIRINEYGRLDDNGKYEIELQGSYTRSYLFNTPHWYWEVGITDTPMTAILLNEAEHVEMIEKYNQWRETSITPLQQTVNEQLNEELT